MLRRLFFLIAVTATTASADIISGTFDWAGNVNYGFSVSEILGSGALTYDTVTNKGTITGLLYSFGTYSGGGTWAFQVSSTLGPYGTFSSPATNVADLFNLSQGTVHDPILGNYTFRRYWDFRPTGGISSGSFDGQEFIATDTQIFNAPSADATLSNFSVSVPEPGSGCLLALAMTALGARRRRSRAA